MMFAPSEDHQPVMWLRGYPMYATHFIVILYVVTMLIATVAGPEGVAAMTGWFGYSSDLVYQGHIWRIFTYGLVNTPSIWFVVDMVVLVWFGRELERFFGRRVFLRFYISLYLLTPVVFTLLGVFRPFALVGETGNFALFIAFATLYPGALMLFNILAKWLAILLVSILTLMHLFSRDFIGLIALWITVGFAHGFVKYERGQFELPRFRLPSFGGKPKFRVVRESDDRPSILADEVDDTTAEVDALLDKIAKSGIGSLTAKEKARLEKAREDLMRREPRR